MACRFSFEPLRQKAQQSFMQELDDMMQVPYMLSVKEGWSCFSQTCCEVLVAAPSLPGCNDFESPIRIFHKRFYIIYKTSTHVFNRSVSRMSSRKMKRS